MHLFDFNTFLNTLVTVVLTVGLPWIGRIYLKYEKKKDEREKQMMARQERYYCKQDAMFYALCISTEQSNTQIFQDAYDKKLKELEAENEVLNEIERRSET